MGTIKSFFSKGLTLGFTLFTGSSQGKSSTRKRRTRKQKTRHHRRRNSRRHIMRGG